ncbi:MAG: 30S ribosomal protein S4 [Candidatus Woesebacteria bacterium GW2011_GWB1_38_5b]|uniref:Small ribosomal subunit protein uS4 n=1 Tax=Candidatus Woesebacteria bacterium GW2011_GWB1_38_5b TaxID=1618569 RepID=A0A0G0N9G1_9BACT|nr:MAG: 30S ribosomal protein S4 [Candidatus Woesebacteria bacterium GW2011_GWB1_38_5b]
MARYTGPKDRLSRREGVDLFGKGSKLTRLNVTPGIHGPKGSMRAPSQFGRQLREKQKVKRLYGVLEKQFRNYVDKALNETGNTGDNLFKRIEARLDNVVYRLGFAQTRPQARQLVSHRHVYINGKKVNIPSYSVKLGDTITLSSKAMEIPSVKKLLQQKDISVPVWLKRKAAAGKMVKIPGRADVVEPVSEQDIVEFYSR